MWRIFTLSVLAAAGCAASAEHPTLPDDYEASVRGLFLDGSKKMCRVSIVDIRQKPQDIIDKLWRDRVGANYIFVGISGGAERRAILASPDLCMKAGVEELSSRLEKVFPNAGIVEQGDFHLYSTADELEKLGLNKIDLSFNNLEKSCSIIRNKKYDIGIDRMLEIRYHLSIPIVYYNSAHGHEAVLFDSNCNKKNEYIKIIDFYNRNMNH